MKKLLLTAVLIALASPAYATVVTVCGPDNGTGCSLAGEQKIYLDVAHDKSTIYGNVNQTGPQVVIHADTGAFDSFLDSGGGFATIDPSQGFKGFNGVTITIPGYTFTDMVFEIQTTRMGGHKGDSEVDQFEIIPLDKVGNVEVIQLDKIEKDSPDAAFQFNVFATSGVLDELNLFADSGGLSAGFDEIKHLQVSGLAAIAVPELSTWSYAAIGFGLLAGLYRTRKEARHAIS